MLMKNESISKGVNSPSGKQGITGLMEQHHKQALNAYTRSEHYAPQAQPCLDRSTVVSGDSISASMGEASNLNKFLDIQINKKGAGGPVSNRPNITQRDTIEEEKHTDMNEEE
jgi:hypothetical protein